MNYDTVSIIPRTILSLKESDHTMAVCVAGWVRSKRAAKRVTFIILNDGSTVENLQIVLEHAQLSDRQHQIIKVLNTGAAIMARGSFIITPNAPQPYELQCTDITLCGDVDIAQYPLQKKEHSHEFLRTIPHLRPRTATYGAIARIRSALSYALHHFFHKEHFYHLHSPIISTHDAEGAGALFRVQPQTASCASATSPPPPIATRPTRYPPSATRSTEQSLSTTSPATSSTEPAQLHATPAPSTPSSATTTPASTTPATEFFNAPAYLSVSGQLNAECYALAMGKVYTFGPTFRAEESHTGRHLSEFWMVEPEIAFCDLNQLIACAQRTVQESIRTCMTDAEEDIDYLCAHNNRLSSTLALLCNSNYHVIEYTEAISLLKGAQHSFEYPPYWGVDLQSEHEKWLLSHCGGEPLFIIHYPKETKAFYMRLNDDGRTVAAVDLIMPEVGELIGGSQREERTDYLIRAMEARAISPEHYQWYIDLRRYGSAVHAGFGLGFDRLVQLVCGMSNIRDVAAFPRGPGHAFC